MLAGLALIAWAAALQDGGRAEEPLDVTQMFVPADRLEKFRDPNSTYQTMRYDAFLELLRQAEAADKARRFIGPTSGTLWARVEPEGRRLVGASTWNFPKGHAGKVELRPWNLRVLAVRERGRSTKLDWGLTADGALVVSGLPHDGRQVDVDWEIPGDAPDRRWTIRGQTPKCASLRIQLKHPADWRAWSANAVESTSLDVETKQLDVRSSGESNWTLELEPAGMLDADRPLLSWRGESTFRFGPTRTDVELRAVVQIDRESASKLRVRVPASLAGLSLATVGATAQWRRDALPDGGVEWTAEYRRPPVGSVQIVAAGSIPTPAGKAWPLERLFVPDAIFRGERVEVVVDPALRLQNLDSGGLVRREFRVENGAGRWALSGFADANRPAVHLGVKRSEVESASQHFLDVRRDRLRLFVRTDWTCVRGELAQAVLLAPAGWQMTKASTEPATRSKSASAETTVDGRLRIALPLIRALATGEKLQTFVQLERPTAGWPLAPGSASPLPEVVALDAEPTGVGVYSVRLDATTPIRLAGDDPEWTISASAAGAPPTGWNWDGDVARFQYFPPLSGASIRSVESRGLAFDAEIVHVVRERESGWDVQTSIEMIPRAGDLGWIDLETSKPIPSDAQWSWNGLESANADLQILSTSPDGGRTRYRLPPRAGADGRARIQVAWGSNAATAETIAVRVPEAERTAVSGVVYCAEGRNVDVVADGWLETTHDSKLDGAEDAANVCWSGRLERGDGGSALAVRKAGTRPNERRTGLEVHGIVHTTGPARRRIFHATLQLHPASPTPFSLAVPKSAKLWSAALDGKRVPAWVHLGRERGAIVFSEPIPAGSHRLEVVFEAASEPDRDLSMPSVSSPWRAGRILWKIDAEEFVWNAHVDPRFLGALVWRQTPGDSLDRQAERVGRGREELDFAARRTARLFRSPPETLDLDRAEDFAAAMRSIQRRLPAGWLVVVERGAAAAAQGASSASPPRTVEEWLSRIGLHLTLGPEVVLLTSRPLESAVDSSGRALSAPDFAATKARELRDVGVESWGAFQTASTLPNASETRDPASTVSSAAAQATVYLNGDDRTLVLPSSNDRSDRMASIVGFLMGVAATALAWVVGRHPSAAVGAAAVAYLFSFAFAGPFAVLLSGFAWGLLAATTVRMLAAYGGRVPQSAAVVATLLGVAVPIFASDESTVLIPYDPMRTNAPLASVEVPEPLLRKLRAAIEDRSSAVVISTADYRGRIVGETIEWKATLAVSVAASEPPIKIPLGFVGVDVQSVESDGKPATILAPTASLPLVATLPVQAKQKLTIAFRTPIAAADGTSTVEFPIPAAAQQSFRISGFTKPIDLVRTNESRGFIARAVEGGFEIAGVRGPTPLVQWVWRERTPETSPTKAATVVSLKPEGRSAAWELQTHFRWERAPGPRRLVVPVPEGVVVRRVEAPGLVAWKSEKDSAGVNRIVATIGPDGDTGATSIYAWFLPRDPKNFSPPLLAPEGAAVRGSVALTLPQDLGLEAAVGRGVVEISATAFSDEWRSVSSFQPPAGEFVAFAFGEENCALEVKARPAAAPLAVSQEHLVRVSPHGRSALWNSAFKFTSVDAVESVALAIPPSVWIDRMESDSLYQWFRNGDELKIRFSKPMSGTWTVRATGRSISTAAGDPGKRPALTPFQPLHGSAGTTTWSVTGEGGVALALASEPPSTCRVERTEKELRIEGPTADAEVSLTVARAPSRIHVRQAAVVWPRSDRWDCRGVMQFRCEGRRPTEIEIATPREMESVEWTAPQFRVVDQGVRDGARRWVAEPRAVGAGTEEVLSIGWRSTVAGAKRDGRRVLDVPILQVAGAASHEVWLAQASVQPVDASPKGFEQERLPAWMQALTAGLGADQQVGVWRTADPKSRIEFSLAAESTPETRVKARGWMDVAVAKTGRHHGRAVWWTTDADERLLLALPSGCEVLSLRVDGKHSAAVAEGEALPIRTDSRARQARIEFEWSAPGADLPTLRNAEIGATLVRIRSPFGHQPTEQRTTRAEWLARLFERECEEWLTRASASEPASETEDRAGLASLQLAAREASGRTPSRADAAWSEFLDKVVALKGEDAAYRLANASDFADEVSSIDLDSGHAAVVDHFEFPGAPTLPPSFDSAQTTSPPVRSPLPYVFVALAFAAAALSWMVARAAPSAKRLQTAANPPPTA